MHFRLSLHSYLWIADWRNRCHDEPEWPHAMQHQDTECNIATVFDETCWSAKTLGGKLFFTTNATRRTVVTDIAAWQAIAVYTWLYIGVGNSRKGCHKNLRSGTTRNQKGSVFRVSLRGCAPRIWGYSTVVIYCRFTMNWAGRVGPSVSNHHTGPRDSGNRGRVNGLTFHLR